MPSFDRDRPIRRTVHTVVARPEDPVCPSRYLTLVIYPDVQQMRAAAHAYNRRRRLGTAAGNDDALGITQTSGCRERYDRRTRTWTDTTGPYVGIIRLARGWLTPEVLAHEATHAAIHVERMHQWARAHATHTDVPEWPEITDESEEPLAAVIGQLTNLLARTVQALVDDGWCDPPGYRFVGQHDPTD